MASFIDHRPTQFVSIDGNLLSKRRFAHLPVSPFPPDHSLYASRLPPKWTAKRGGRADPLRTLLLAGASVQLSTFFISLLFIYVVVVIFAFLEDCRSDLWRLDTFFAILLHSDYPFRCFHTNDTYNIVNDIVYNWFCEYYKIMKKTSSEYIF